MEAKQILINIKIPSLADTPEDSKNPQEDLLMLRSKALDETMLAITREILLCGYSFEEILMALAAYPESENWVKTERLLEKAASAARKKH
jgi:hypothetical protein